MIEAFENLNENHHTNTSHTNHLLMNEVVDLVVQPKAELDHAKSSVYDRYSSAFDSFDSPFKQQQQQQQINYLNRFQYIVVAPTSPAVKCSEETLTYLNQGQNYELKLNYSSPTRSDAFYANCSSNNALDEKKFDPSSCEFDGWSFLSVIRLCFWDRKLQEIEHEEIKEWEKEYQNIRMLEIDSNTSTGVFEVRHSPLYINICEVIWNGKTGASLTLRCNCTSTAFAPHKHGGEKGIHMRIQIDTYEATRNNKIIESNSECCNLDNNNNNNSDHASSSDGGTGGASSLDLPTPPPSSSTSLVVSPSSTNKKRLKDDSSFDSYGFNFAQLSSSPAVNSSVNQLRYYLCSSYARIQLFRLKGAQRKLKTDRGKIERLTPNDLRKRYQISSKVTVFYNSTFDPLYSTFPTTSSTQQAAPMSITNGISPTNTSTTTTSSSSSSSSSASSSFQMMVTTTTTPSIATTSVANTSTGPLATTTTGSVDQGYYQSHYGTGSTVEFGCIPPSDAIYGGVYSNMNGGFSSTNSQALPLNSYVDHSGLMMTSGGHFNTNDSSSIGDHYYGTYENYSNMNFSLKRTSSYNSVDTLHQYADQTCNKMLKSSHHHHHHHHQHHHHQANYTLLPPISQHSTTSSSSSSSSSSPSSTSSKSISPSSSLDSPASSSSSPQSPVKREMTVLTQFSTPSSAAAAVAVPSSPLQQQQQQQQPIGGPSNDEPLNGLPHNCNSKYVEEWLVRHRFGNLVPLFGCYASNDVLRLSKEDVVKLCGPPDGIRLYNLAHNIQIKPKLSIFVTFRARSFYTAVFLTEWKVEFLIQRIIAAYFAYVKSPAKNEPTATTAKSSSYNLDVDSSNNENNNQDLICNELVNRLNDYELFLKVQGILVKTNDEVLNNLQDQSKFLVSFELPSTTATSRSSSTSTDQTTSTTSTTTTTTSGNRMNLVKIIMIPLD